MSAFERFLLIIDTLFVAIGIIVYLSNLKNKSTEHTDLYQERSLQNREIALSAPDTNFSESGSITEGEVSITGVEDEVIPVILASVSAFSNIPLSSLKVKSINRLSE